MRHGVKESPNGHQQHTITQPARLGATAAEISNWYEAQYDCNVVHAGNQTSILTLNIKAFLDTGETHIDETVHDETLVVTRETTCTILTET